LSTRYGHWAVRGNTKREGRPLSKVIEYDTCGVGLYL